MRTYAYLHLQVHRTSAGCCGWKRISHESQRATATNAAAAALDDARLDCAYAPLGVKIPSVVVERCQGRLLGRLAPLFEPAHER